jgi:hypothetical protein
LLAQCRTCSLLFLICNYCLPITNILVLILTRAINVQGFKLAGGFARYFCSAGDG